MAEEIRSETAEKEPKKVQLRKRKTVKKVTSVKKVKAVKRAGTERLAKTPGTEEGEKNSGLPEEAVTNVATAVFSKPEQVSGKNKYVFHSDRHYERAFVLKASVVKKKGFFRNLFPSKGDSVFECIRKTVFIIAFCAAVVCFAFVGQYYYENHQNAKRNDALEEMYRSAETEEDTGLKGGYGTADYQGRLTDSGDTEDSYTMIPGARLLLEINENVAGYISIPGLDIDYPLMQNRVDNNEYLHKDLYGNHLRAGSIMLDFRANFDVVENSRLAKENSDCLVVYGHNMMDESMFGKLKHYRTDEDWYEKYPIIELNSNYRKYKYKIFAYFVSDPHDKTDTYFDYWNTQDFDDEAQYFKFINEIKKRSLRNNDVDMEYGDPLLLLSTCTSLIGDGRFVVAARMIREDEDELAGVEGSSVNKNALMPSSYYKGGKVTFDEDKFEPYVASGDEGEDLEKK